MQNGDRIGIGVHDGKEGNQYSLLSMIFFFHIEFFPCLSIEFFLLW